MKATSPQKIFLVSFLSMTIAMATLAYATYQACYNILVKDLGLRAQFTAQVAANLVEVDQELVQEMLGLDILSSRNHIEALEFKRKVEPLLRYNDIKYIYVETRLTGNQIKYFVNPDEEKIFNEPPGTPMEYFYVLTSRDERAYSNRDRYDVGNAIREKAHNGRIPTYGLPASGKWGSVITGYQPIYDSKHRFVGLLGVDIAGDYFDQSIWYVKNIIMVSFGIIVMLGGVILYQASKTLSKPMYMDQLTKLFNREYLKTRLESEISRSRRSGRPLSLLMLDIDYFKSVNDRYGHQNGDIVLKKISEVILISIREEDIACRYGGEEIAVILPDIGLSEATIVAERLCKTIETTCFFVDHQEEPLHTTTSIGVAQWSEHDTMDSLIKKADDALYRAKKNGRNQYQCCGELK
ncbi:GGDEF domain-containing protein [Desulfotomaculum sp. 1211_IL3151]|uniref:GGDEF domain-containing protein n=1 Tax=Desulfotomaculum sp. 1211_IL3151 TaxID=3084055 RepID=UPI002FDB1893